ncbi:hypothetical protein MDA_GLEAN10001142 [Myotis davidii]|uniref:Uncharacterized protein n=1 Tax=Myotis davidii TaxID=225400 RepID=L5MB27_MYODS|nr:hypothetical protein MDA_GLEAN10001142 [Myotis davidii]
MRGHLPDKVDSDAVGQAPGDGQSRLERPPMEKQSPDQLLSGGHRTPIPPRDLHWAPLCQLLGRTQRAQLQGEHPGQRQESEERLIGIYHLLQFPLKTHPTQQRTTWLSSQHRHLLGRQGISLFRDSSSPSGAGQWLEILITLD